MKVVLCLSLFLNEMTIKCEDAIEDTGPDIQNVGGTDDRDLAGLKLFSRVIFLHQF